jgi:hemolysin III
MVWSCVIAIYPLFKAVPAWGMFWLIFGGLVYTLGAVIYGMKWPNFAFTNSGIFL